MALPRMYGWDETAELVGISTRQLREWVEQGRFPMPHKSGPTARWFDYEISEWQTKFKLGLIPPPPPKEKKKRPKAEGE